MSVLILNLTGNKVGFEDALCENLKQEITAPTDVISARGQSLLTNTMLQNRSSEILVIVAHACPDGNSCTSIDTGLFEPSALVDANIQKVFEQQLESPTVLMQILGSSPNERIVVFCACSATSPETIVSVVSGPSCIAVVTSKDPVDFKDSVLVANIVNSLQQMLAQSITDYPALSSTVSQIVKNYGGNPEFRCFPALKPQEE